MPAIPIAKLIKEVESGLSTEAKHRMDRALEAQDFHDFRGKQQMMEFRNDAETPLDYIKRPYRESGLTRQAVRILTQHLYSPGPSRRWDDAGAQEFLDRVYADNHIDAKMLRADQLSHLGDVCAIQVDADDSTFEDAPITLRLWGAEEFHVWEDPDDRTCPMAVVTKDMYDQTTRYRLWTDDEVYTFLTKKGDQTSGGRVAYQVGREDNTYGCIPFAFVHNESPERCFWEAGIGDLIVRAEIRFNDRLSRLDQSIHKHLNPFPWVKGAPDGFQILLGQPNMFIQLPGRARVPGPVGEYQAPETPEVGYLQATIDIAGAWEDARGFILQVFEAAGIPQSAVRMEQTGVASGISLIVEQAPLLTRARERRPFFARYERCLGRRILECAGNHYGKAALVAASSAVELATDWPEPSIPVPTDDWYTLQMQRVATGTTSIVRVVMEERGVGREQAIEILRQIEEDRAELARIMPDLQLPTYAGQNPEPEGDEEQGDESEGDE